MFEFYKMCIHICSPLAIIYSPHTFHVLCITHPHTHTHIHSENATERLGTRTAARYKYWGVSFSFKLPVGWVLVRISFVLHNNNNRINRTHTYTHTHTEQNPRKNLAICRKSTTAYDPSTIHVIIIYKINCIRFCSSISGCIVNVIVYNQFICSVLDFIREIYLRLKF